MDLKKQAIVLGIIVGLIGGGQLLYQYLFNQHSSPAKSAIHLITNHLDPQVVLEFVSSQDKLAVQELQKEYVSLTKLPKVAVASAEVVADITISPTAHKIDLNTSQGVVSLNMIQEDGRWVAFLNLKKNFELKKLLESLKAAELEEDEFKMLTIFRKLNELSPAEEYQVRIEKLTRYIEEKEAKAGYVKNIVVSDLSLKGRVLTGEIKNIGNKSVSVIKVNLQLVQKDGTVTEEIPVVLYEVIPGSLVFGQPIHGGYQKKFGLNVQNLKQIVDTKNLAIEVTEVEFIK